MLYYRDKTGREVDLIIEQGSDVRLYEVKYTHTIRPDFYKHMKYVSKNMSVKSVDVIYAGVQQFPNVLNWMDLIDIQKLFKS